MLLELSQVYPGNASGLKYDFVLPVRIWGTRTGMVQPDTGPGVFKGAGLDGPGNQEGM